MRGEAPSEHQGIRLGSGWESDAQVLAFREGRRERGRVATHEPGRPRPVITVSACDLCEHIIHTQKTKLNRCKKMQSEKD